MSTTQRAQSPNAEHVCQRLTSAVARRIDKDHLRLPDETIGHPVPHVAGHQQTRPEHDRLARSADLHPHLFRARCPLSAREADR